MNIDEIIAALLEAKEHLVDGRTIPHIQMSIAFDGDIYTAYATIDEITYNDTVHIKMTEK